MTTPTDGEWMSADDALTFLGLDTICSRAHNGLIRAKAEQYIDDGGRSFDDVELPRQFWWRAREITGDWETGDLETTSPDSGGRLQAFGVQFRRSDIEKLKPATAASSTAPLSPTQRRVGRTVFIGHGHSLEWLKLRDFLRDSLHLNVVEFNSTSAAGVSTTERLGEMLEAAGFAFLVLTGEDVQATGKLNPRLNVIHEAGLFQGKLGFKKAIILKEEGCEDFSNVHGLGEIWFPKGNIGAQSEEIRRVLEREGIKPGDGRKRRL